MPSDVPHYECFDLGQYAHECQSEKEKSKTMQAIQNDYDDLDVQ